MDIKSIIDSDASTAPPTHSAGRKQSESQQGYQQPKHTFHIPYETQSPAYNIPRETRPAQPPPLQPPTHNGSRSPSTSSYNSVQSPYQHTPSSTLSGGQYPFPQHTNQSPAHGFQASPYASRESHTTSAGTIQQPYGATTPIVLTPLAIASGSSPAYSHHPRQTSSHSTSTPTSAQNQILNFFRESPQGSQSQIRASSQSHSSQQYISQPGTPLGPPPTIGRPLSNLHRESPGSYEHRRSHSGGSHGYQQAFASSPRTDLPGSSTASPLGDEAEKAQSSNPGFPRVRERERSLSVSPKTRTPNQLQISPSYMITDNDARPQSFHPVSDLNPQRQKISHGIQENINSGQTSSWDTKLIPTKRKLGGEIPENNLGFSQHRQNHGPTRSHAQGGIYNLDESSKSSKDPPQTARHQYSAGIANIKADNTKNDYKLSPLTNQLEPVQISKPLSATQQLPIAHPLSNQQSASSTFPHQQSLPVSHQPQSLPYSQTPFPHPQFSLSSHQQHSPSSHQVQPSSHQQSPSFSHQPPSSSHQNLTSFSNPPSNQSPNPPPNLLPIGQSVSSFHQVATSQELSKQIMTPAMPQTLSLLQETETQLPVSSIAGLRTAKKRQRPTEIPSFARSTRTSSHYLPPKVKRSLVKPVQPIQQGSTAATPAIATQTPSQPKTPPMAKEEAKHQANGYPSVKNAHLLPKAEPLLTDLGPLGPWEPSITNVIPSEEIVRVISDFLFAEVVSRDDVGAGPAGGGTGKGAVLEVEAKIGQLIDRNTNDRLRLPVMTECVVGKNDPNLRLAFKSSMTETQHRSLNEFLNKALVNSQTSKPSPAGPPPTLRSRAAMSYVHTYECDSFFELSQSGALSLPTSIRAQLNPRNTKAKVRITTDQKTGNEIARIVKARVADIDVYSPRTPFDWRISVNVEMNFDGDLATMTLPASIDGKRSDRNKDRMSYRHQAYQIDLTQVTPTEATSKTEKEHELEIEVSTAEVRRQGLLARDGHANDYEKLIRGFVDNVRLLARHCQ